MLGQPVMRLWLIKGLSMTMLGQPVSVCTPPDMAAWTPQFPHTQPLPHPIATAVMATYLRAMLPCSTEPQPQLETIL